MFVEVAASAANDVREMSELCGEIADRTATSTGVKDRTAAVANALGLGWNRAFELLKGKARLVQSFEKDNARQVRNQLRAAARRQRHIDHLAWLEEQIARHRAKGTAFHGAHADGLEHLLRSARGEVGPDAGDPD